MPNPTAFILKPGEQEALADAVAGEKLYPYGHGFAADPFSPKHSPGIMRALAGKGMVRRLMTGKRPYVATDDGRAFDDARRELAIGQASVLDALQVAGAAQ